MPGVSGGGGVRVAWDQAVRHSHQVPSAPLVESPHNHFIFTSQTAWLAPRTYRFKCEWTLDGVQTRLKASH